MLSTNVNLDKLIELNDTLNELEKIYKPMKEQVVAEMIAQGVNSFDHNGRKMTLSITERWSKMELDGVGISKLNQLGLAYLIDKTYALSKDRAQVELKQGKVSKETLNTIVSIGETKTFKIK